MADESQEDGSSTSAPACCEGSNQQPHNDVNDAAHERDEKIRKRIGEALILTVYVVFDLRDEWPKNHISALILGVIAISSILLMELRWKKWAVATTALVIIAAIILRVAHPVLLEETESHGWLLPANDSTPPNGCDRDPIPADAVLFIAGTNAAWTTAQGKSDVFKLGGIDTLSVERDGSRLSFDADIYSDTGNLAVRIEHNEFHLISGEYSYQQRNENRSELIVFDKKGRNMLDVYYANPNTVLVRGFFTFPDGTKIQIDDQQIWTIDDGNSHESGNCKGGFAGTKAAFTISRGHPSF